MRTRLHSIALDYTHTHTKPIISWLQGMEKRDHKPCNHDRNRHVCWGCVVATFATPHPSVNPSPEMPEKYNCLRLVHEAQNQTSSPQKTPSCRRNSTPMKLQNCTTAWPNISDCVVTKRQQEGYVDTIRKTTKQHLVLETQTVTCETSTTTGVSSLGFAPGGTLIGGPPLWSYVCRLQRMWI